MRCPQVFFVWFFDLEMYGESRVYGYMYKAGRGGGNWHILSEEEVGVNPQEQLSSCGCPPGDEVLL